MPQHKKTAPLSPDIEAFLLDFLKAVSKHRGKEELLERVKPIESALAKVRRCSRALSDALDGLVQEVLRVSELGAADGDSCRAVLLSSRSSPLLADLRERSTGSKIVTGGEKSTPRFVLNTELLSGLIAFGNKKEFPIVKNSPQSRPCYPYLFGRHMPHGPDWLTLCLVQRIISNWKHDGRLFGTEELSSVRDELARCGTDADSLAPPSKWFSFRPKGGSGVFSCRYIGRGKKQPLEWMTFMDMIEQLAPLVGPTILARRLIALSREHESELVPFPLSDYRQGEAEERLSRLLKDCRANLRRTRRNPTH